MIFRNLTVIILTALSIQASAQQKEHYYKHLEAEINREVYLMIDLVKAGSELTESCYYYYNSSAIDTGRSQFGKITPILAEIDKQGNIKFAEFTLADKGILKQEQLLYGIKITGTLQPNDSSPAQNFEIYECYPEGTMPFVVYHKKAERPFDPKSSSSPAAKASLTLILPADYENKAVSDSVRKAITGMFFTKTDSVMTVEKMLENEAELYFTNYKTSNDGLTGTEAVLNWEKISRVIVHYNRDFILSLEIFDYGYTGGAHGFPLSSFMVISLADGSTIRLEDLFIEGYQDFLSNAITEQVRMDNGLAAGTSLKDAGFFADSLFVTQNFYLTKDGIGFVYNRYEVAPYAMGSPEVFIPFLKLESIMRKESIVRPVE